jgi:hypothetical protein
MFLFGYWWMEREQKRIGSKERFTFWLLVDGMRPKMHWIGEEGEGRKREQRKLRGGEGK